MCVLQPKLSPLQRKLSHLTLCTLCDLDPTEPYAKRSRVTPVKPAEPPNLRFICCPEACRPERARSMVTAVAAHLFGDVLGLDIPGALVLRTSKPVIPAEGPASSNVFRGRLCAARSFGYASHPHNRTPRLAEALPRGDPSCTGAALTVRPTSRASRQDQPSGRKTEISRSGFIITPTMPGMTA